MQITSTCPDKLALPENVKTALINHLLEPFQNLSEAKAFWLENSVHLIISEPPEDAVTEYTEPLSSQLGHYRMQLIVRLR